MILAVVALAGLAFAGPSLGSSYTIQARNYAFVVPGGGSSLVVTVGDQVTWVAGGDPHTVTSGTPGAIDQRFVDHPAGAGLLKPGDTFTTTFTVPGTYPYFCEIHPEQMSGTVTVVASATSPATPAPTTPSPTRAPSPRPTATPTVPSTVPPTAPPTAPPTTSPPSSSAGTGSPAPSVQPSTAPSAPATGGGVPTSSPSAATDAGAGRPVDPRGYGSASGDTPAIAVVAGLGILAVAAGALAFRRRNRGT
ncbi:MAG: plastocyanin/azurin family copper-binding protein [Chloroflexota bacterium]